MEDKIITEEIPNTSNTETVFEENYDSENLHYDEISLLKEFEIYRRFFLRKIRKYFGSQKKTKIKNILHLTLKDPNFTPLTTDLCSSFDFSENIRKQYPDHNIIILFPIIGLNFNLKPAKRLEYENNDNKLHAVKVLGELEFFAGNKNHKCCLYKFSEAESVTPVYGIFSESFSYLKSIEELSEFKNLILFLKSSRLIIKNFDKIGIVPDIVQSDKIPFFAGCEFEQKFPSSTKVLQIIDDLSVYANFEDPFYAFINIADKQNIRKVCKDEYIIKGLRALLSLNQSANTCRKIENAIDLIFDNYENLGNFSDKDIQEKQSMIIKYLDARIRKLYPNLVSREEMQYYPIITTIKKANCISVVSKTYFKQIFDDYNLIPSKLRKHILQAKEKFKYISLALNTSAFPTESGYNIYHYFNVENFRTKRIRNKNTLIREFSETRLKTDFVDKTLFLNDNYKIYGYLDYFYDSPLIFADIGNNVELEGIDLLFDTVMKLFEQNKNVKIILSSANGFKSGYAKTRIDFFNESKLFAGRWIFIDGRVNLPRFMAASDIYLAPNRGNVFNMKAMLGMHFGCIPVVSAFGFQNDYVTDIFDDLIGGNGLKVKFSLDDDKNNSKDFYEVVSKALDIYKNNPSGRNSIIKNCLTADLGWNFEKLELFDKIYSVL